MDLHRWVQLAIQIHGPRADTEAHTCALGGQGPMCKPAHVLTRQACPDAQIHVHMTFRCSRDHVPLRLWCTSPSACGCQCVQTQLHVHLRGYTHRHGRARKAALPRKIPSQRGRHSLPPSLWGQLCLCQVVWPWEQSQNLWSGIPQVPHAGLSPPHSATPLTRHSLLSVGKALRLEVIKSLSSFQQH